MSNVVIKSLSKANERGSHIQNLNYINLISLKKIITIFLIDLVKFIMYFFVLLFSLFSMTAFNKKVFFSYHLQILNCVISNQGHHIFKKNTNILAPQTFLPGIYPSPPKATFYIIISEKLLKEPNYSLPTLSCSS